MIISNKYEILEKIGEGAFGKIYKGQNIRTGEKVAIKVEPIENKTQLLKNETKIYQYLAGEDGIPQVKWFGVDETNNYMVTTLLRDSLSDLKKKYEAFSMDHIFQIGIKIVERLKFIHEKNLIHRDVKPDNFLFGPSNKLYIIDFGLCKKYVNEEGHIKNVQLTKILGTPTFVSLNIHNLNTPSRRDDLESMIYILMYLFFDKLEWSECENANEIKRKKERLLDNENIPIIFKDVLMYIRRLTFEEKPDYDRIIKYFCVK
jgi:serine/threonine protein kinase